MLLYRARSGHRPDGGLGWETRLADVNGHCTDMEEVSAGAAAYSLPLHGEVKTGLIAPVQ